VTGFRHNLPFRRASSSMMHLKDNVSICMRGPCNGCKLYQVRTVVCAARSSAVSGSSSPSYALLAAGTELHAAASFSVLQFSASASIELGG
jgi:hypothetical protein